MNDLTTFSNPEFGQVRTVEINGYRCTVCGYVYEGESLPPDFRCPLCHAPAEKFVKIEKYGHPLR